MEPNNYKKAAEDSKRKKIVEGVVKTRPKIKNIIFAEGPESIKDHVLYDIMFPAIKQLLANVAHGFVDTAFFGAAGVRYGGYTAYNKAGDGKKYSYNPGGRSVDNLIFETRIDAERVLDDMYDKIEKYHQVSVGDLYDMIGKSTNGYTDRKIGWTKLDGAKILVARDGFLLELPKFKDLD